MSVPPQQKLGPASPAKAKVLRPSQILLICLFALPALYLIFLAYQAGTALVALGFLLITCLGVYIYLSPRLYTYRYLFPGLLGFGLFVVFPLVFTVYISFTKYSSPQNVLSFASSLEILQNETYGEGSYRYGLYRQADGKYILSLQDDANSAHRFISEPLQLTPGQATSGEETGKLTEIPPSFTVPGLPLNPHQVIRQKLYLPLRKLSFRLPNGSIVRKYGLRHFTVQDPLWISNRDGSLTNKVDGTRVRPDFKDGFFKDDRGGKVGVGFRTFFGFGNYLQILTDPRIQGPFFKIFLWTATFSALSVLGSFAVGMVLAVLLQWKELRFRKTYRTLLILPYAVPAVLSILIFKGLFNQDLGVVNEVLRTLFHFAPEWETNPWGARAMLILVNIWLSYPYFMLVCTGMVQSIPSNLYEVSAIDGSNPMINFFRITLPLVLPPLIPILIASYAFNFNNFNLVFLLTQGGPRMIGGGIAGESDLLVTYTFNLAFRDTGANFGLASAIATLLFILVALLALLNLRISARKMRL